MNQKAPSIENLKNLRVMVVDDVVDIAEIISFVLKRNGAMVQTCNSVADAMSAFDLFNPDVLISDISMPGEDGFSFIARLRAMGCEVPAIALTAFTDQYNESMAISAGFNKYMTKPFSNNYLIEQTRLLLHK